VINYGFEFPQIVNINPIFHHSHNAYNWNYGNQGRNNQFGYCPSAIAAGSTQNAGFEQNQPSDGFCSWDFKKIMSELNRQSSQKTVAVELCDEIYTIKNRYNYNANELGYKLADQSYDKIRENDTDIFDITRNLNMKAENIKKCKDHIFYRKYTLDLYGQEETDYKRFDPDLKQAVLWKRMQAGTHTPKDITWLKHEYVKQSV